MKNRGIPENTEKDLQAIPADSWPLHGDRGLFQFDRKMSSGANDQAKVLKYAAFRDQGWGHVALYPR